MKIETKTKSIEVTFPSDRRYEVNIDFQEKTIGWLCLTISQKHPTVKDLRTYASELSQIAQLVQDELNKIHGYEFNEEVKNAKTETIKEIVESVNEENEEDKLRKIYFALYDKMDEPERSQAKENWSYEATKELSIPKNIKDCIWVGFAWADTPQGRAYWKHLCFEKYANK